MDSAKEKNPSPGGKSYSDLDPGWKLHISNRIRILSPAFSYSLGLYRILNRHGGGAMTLHVNARVIVDMREFRSELPSLLHKRGIDIG